MNRAESIFLWYTSNLIFTYPLNATGRIWRSPLMDVQFLKCLMFVAFMESVSLNSPIPIPLQTVKRGVYSIHMYWISKSCGPSGRREQEEKCSRGNRRWRAILHPRSKHCQAHQGPGAMAGCEAAVQEMLPVLTELAFSSSFSPPGPESSCPGGLQLLLHYSCPLGCWYHMGITRVPPLNPQCLPLPSSGLQLSFLMERNSMHKFFN